MAKHHFLVCVNTERDTTNPIYNRNYAEDALKAVLFEGSRQALAPNTTATVADDNKEGWLFDTPCGPCLSPWNCYCRCYDCTQTQIDPNRPSPPEWVPLQTQKEV